MSNEEIFDIIRAETLDLLGVYTATNVPSVQFPAINFGSDTPIEFNVSGCEVLVSPNYVYDSTPVVGRKARVEKESQILVRQWTTNETTSEMVERLIKLFPKIRVGPTVPATRETLEQVRLSLYASEFIG